MSFAETQQLAAELTLKGNFVPVTRAAEAALGRLDRAVGKTGINFRKAGSQIGTGLARSAAIGTIGLAAFAVQVRSGLNTLVELERLTKQTGAVLKSTGGVAGQTAASIRNLAEKYEGLNATIDDKVIQSGENVLLTFTAIRKEAFEPALAAALDLSTAMGQDLQSSIVQVGKALNDPIRGITALRRVGVQLTVAQEKQIKTLVKQGDTLGAQRVILRELNKEFGGSFLAGGQSTAGKVAKFQDSIEDLQKALATALLPTMGKLADAGSKFFADPKVIAGAERIGEKIAGLFNEGNLKAGAEALQNAFAAVKGALPAIESGLKFSGEILSKSIALFRSLPPEIQQLAVAGLAVNKLTGGLVTNVAGGLAGSLIKGILGQLRSAVVNVQGAVVNVGGVPGVPGAGGGGIGGAVKGAVKFVLPIAAGVVIANAIREAAGITPEQGAAQQSKGQFGPRTQAQGDARKAAADLAAAQAAAVFADGSYDAAEKIKGAANAVAGGLTGAADAARKAYRALVADRAALEKGRGGTNRITFVGGGSNAAAVAGANYLAQKFASSQKPFYQNMSNAARSLSALKALQARFLARGDTHNAALVGRDIKIMQGVLARKSQAQKDAASMAGEKAARAAQRTTAAVDRKKLNVAVTTNVVARTVIDGRQYSSELSRTTNYSGAR